MGKRTTGVTGILVEGNFGRAVTIYSTDTGYVAEDRSSGTAITFDPFLAQWLTQRAVSSASIRTGLKDQLSLVRLDKISAELKKDKRAFLFSTKQFVEKMDPTNAPAILADLEAQAAAAAAA